MVVARDARRVFAHTLRALPSDAAPVRALLSIYARHQALHAYYALRAEAAGLDTEAGLAFLAVADRQTDRTPEEICRKAGIPLLLAPSIKAGLDIDWSDPKQKALAVDVVERQVSSLQRWVDRHLDDANLVGVSRTSGASRARWGLR